MMHTIACSSPSDEASQSTPFPSAHAPAPDLPLSTAPAGVTEAGRLADGRYFGRLIRVDVAGAILHFLPVCEGETNLTLRALPAEEQVTVALRVAPSAQLFIHRAVRQGDPSSGSFRPVDLAQIAQSAQNDSVSKWWVTVNRDAISWVEQDSGLRCTAQPDDPCPH